MMFFDYKSFSLYVVSSQQVLVFGPIASYFSEWTWLHFQQNKKKIIDLNW